MVAVQENRGFNPYIKDVVRRAWPAYSAALAEHQKEFTVHFYPEGNHGFHNDTTPRYDPAAAESSWQRTLECFDTHLM